MNLEQKLGFDQIRQSIKMRCSTGYAQNRAETEEVSYNPQTIEKRLALTDEMRLVAMFETKFPQGEFTDCTQFLKALTAEFSCISVENLRRLQNFLESLRQVLSFLKNTKPEQYPNIKQLAAPIPYFPEVSRRIDSILDKNGEIKDSASEELAKIRRELSSTQNSISRKVQSIFKKAQSEGIADEDASISVRDGKLLIPVSTSNKRGLPGLVFDESSSGKTVFVEPLEVVEMNNKVRELHFAEQREIAKILAEFTDFLRPYLIDIQGGARFIGEVDFIRAKAEVAGVMQAGKPIISRDGMLRISNGRHPLLEAALRKENKPIVPMTLEINRKKHILIISGPNAGGKSVCLKTVGILQYMFQWGMLVPCSEVSEFPVFNKIFIDIGDEQSIENDLSTYSSHLMNMKNMMKQSDGQTLLLIDEFGTGTEPQIGGAIAESVLKQFCSKGAYGVITTQDQNRKHFAEAHDGVVNGAMLYDRNEMQALFQLQIGNPGSSFAIEIARKTGIPEEVIADASAIVGSDYIQSDKYLQDIVRDKRYWENKRQTIHQREKVLEQTIKKYEAEVEDVDSNRKAILKKAKEEAEELLRTSNAKIENAIRAIKEAQAEKAETKSIREELESFKNSVAEIDTKDDDEKIANKIKQIQERKKRHQERLKKKTENAAVGEQPKDSLKTENKVLAEGDTVRIKGQTAVGTVASVDGKMATVIFGDMRTKLRIERLEKAVKPIKEEPKTYASVGRHTRETIDEKKLNFKQDIDVRGMRGDEAINAVTYFIDDAILVGMARVRILHGTGSGILRQLIRQYLSTIPGVKDFRDEHVQFGGTGITVVDLE